jgi:hypothetical protein
MVGFSDSRDGGHLVEFMREFWRFDLLSGGSVG